VRFQIGVGEGDRARYQQIVAAILHIGEISFVEKVRPPSHSCSPFFSLYISGQAALAAAQRAHRILAFPQARAFCFGPYCGVCV
jgi:hypothetical protein